MKLISFINQNQQGVGLVVQSQYFDLRVLRPEWPQSTLGLLEQSDKFWEALRELNQKLCQDPHGDWCSAALLNPEHVQLLAPVPNPPSVRDAYAFRQHVETSRRNRGLPMIPEFDEIPVFYFSNHRAVTGPGEVHCMPLHLNQLDFELEVAIVIKKQGRNIPVEQADDYIAGFMIMNDWSARALQMQEMKLNLGPAKGKDFATSFGPYLVTPDELEPYRVAAPQDHQGACYRLDMRCHVNHVLVSQGCLSDMNWTFAEIIARASYGVDLYPGDIIGSGTVGTGCFLELNGTGKLREPESYQEQWLQAGDTVVLEVSELGSLRNVIRLYD